jgi:hypothetical protein
MTLLSDKLSLIGLLVILLEVALVVLVVSPEQVRRARVAEQETATAVFGAPLAARARAFAERKFGETFVESGFLARVEGMLVPTDEARSRATGIETLGTDTFGWVRTRLGTLAATLFGAYHRLYLMGLMAMVALALVIGALTDALVERKTALLNSEITNAVFYHSAKGVLFWLLLLPVLIAISPVTIRSTALIVWGVSVPLLLWVGARNVQEM